MQELIIKMVFCLLVALALGFIFGWLIKRAFSNEKYRPIIEDLEGTLAESNYALKKSEDESNLIKEQFVTSKEDLDVTTLKVTELEEHLGNYQTKVIKLEGDVKGKESHIQEVLQVSNLLHTQLDDGKKELDLLTKKSHNQQEKMDRIREHHTLLQNQVDKLTQDKEIKEQELGKLSIMIGDYKTNEQKLLDETKAQEGKLTELKTTLNERNIAALELGHKVKEIDKLHIMITDYKSNEEKFLDEKKAQAGKLTELHATLNEKNIATLELGNKVKEIDKLHIMITDYKANEEKFLHEKKAQEGKLTELHATLNEKNIATLELGNKVKEIDKLHIMITDYKANEEKFLHEKKAQEGKLTELHTKTETLGTQLSSAQKDIKSAKETSLRYKNSLADFEKKVIQQKSVTPQEVADVIDDVKGEGFFDKLEHATKENTSEKSHSIKPSGEGFNFVKFAKKTLDKITTAGDDINTQADKVIQEYKDRK